MEVFKSNLPKVMEIMDSTKHDYELIIVDDGSKDGSLELIKELNKKNKNINYIVHERNKGRGKSVSDGMKIAKGNIVGFIDIDLEVSESYIPSFILEIEKGADVVNALRHYKNKRPFHRWLASVVYRILAPRVLGTKIRDSEAGFKFFKTKKILRILDSIQSNHWFWDTEVMSYAYLEGFKVVEKPVVFIRKMEIGSTVKFFRDVKHYLVNLFKFKRRLLREYTKN